MRNEDEIRSDTAGDICLALVDTGNGSQVTLSFSQPEMLFSRIVDILDLVLRAADNKHL
jgi:hypothetical protein